MGFCFLNIKLAKDKYSTIILMPFFKTKYFFCYYVDNKVWLLKLLWRFFIFPITSSLSDVPGVEELIAFILLVVYYQSQDPSLPLQSISSDLY